MAAVPGLLRRAQRQKRHHAVAPNDPHFSWMLPALFNCPKRIDAVFGPKCLPGTLDGLG